MLCFRRRSGNVSWIAESEARIEALDSQRETKITQIRWNRNDSILI